MGLVAGVALTLLGLLAAALLGALVTGQATGTADDQTVVGVLAGSFLVLGLAHEALICTSASTP